jgi:hypothetical protein
MFTLPTKTGCKGIIFFSFIKYIVFFLRQEYPIILKCPEENCDYQVVEVFIIPLSLFLGLMI